MNWINRKDQEPDLKLQDILVWDEYDEHALACWDNQCWCYHNGCSVDFTFWYPIPQRPCKTCQTTQEESKCGQEPLMQFKHLLKPGMASITFADVLIDHEKRLGRIERAIRKPTMKEVNDDAGGQANASGERCTVGGQKEPLIPSTFLKNGFFDICRCGQKVDELEERIRKLEGKGKDGKL